ncbi:hypothetical protein [Clostridium sp. HBUAS56017]|uniref:hypothetical protein n=1 Tax=Clostridium sp. HBUAS56017 TaxID=2571128 RepID=UPI0011785343|nr:hypothetical protein [Clostridium sp. HBUAS56017]
MSISIGINRPIVMNTGYTKDNRANLLMKQKESLQKQIQLIEKDKGSNDSEKKKKIDEVKKQIDKVNVEIDKESVEKVKEGSKEILKKMTEQIEKDDSVEEKERDGNVAVNYSLISASSDGKHVQKLNGYRKKAIHEDGINSSRVRRIDQMIEEKMKNIQKSLISAKKAVEEYSKNSKIKSEEKGGEGNSNTIGEREDTDIKVDVKKEETSKEKDISQKGNRKVINTRI